MEQTAGLPHRRETARGVLLPLLTALAFGAMLAWPFIGGTVRRVEAAPAISLFPPSGPPVFTNLTVTGTDFPAGPINVMYDTALMGTAIPAAGGGWTLSFPVPQSASGLTHTVFAGTAQQDFLVTRGATISPTSGPPGAGFSITGYGFAANEQGIVVSFNGSPAGTVVANVLGTVMTSFAVPAIPAGSYSVTIGAAPAQSFVVTSSLVLSPTIGPVGTTLNLTGLGFAVNALVSVTFDGVLVRSTATDPQGGVATSFQAPSAPGGSHSVGVSVASGGSVIAAFTVTPSIALDRQNAAPGAAITVTGNGFGANESNISVTFDATVVASSLTADSQGRWTGSFTTPPTSGGSHSVRASGSLTAASNVPVSTLSISAGIRLDRSSGAPGTQVQVTGFGFPASTSGIVITVGNSVATSGGATNDQGQLNATVTIPSAPAGALTVRAQAPGSAPAEASFTVSQGISLPRRSGSPGTAITVDGSGFPANARDITVTLGSATAVVAANQNGAWTTTLVVPSSPSGTYTVRSGGSVPAAEASFSVTPGVSVSANRGAPGTSLTVNGAGFGSSESGISVSFAQKSLASGVAANSNGSWTVSITVPPTPGGTYAFRPPRVGS